MYKRVDVRHKREREREIELLSAHLGFSSVCRDVDLFGLLVEVLIACTQKKMLQNVLVFVLKKLVTFF